MEWGPGYEKPTRAVRGGKMEFQETGKYRAMRGIAREMRKGGLAKQIAFVSAILRGCVLTYLCGRRRR